MSEHEPASLEELLAGLHPGTIEWAEVTEREVTEDFRLLKIAQQWLVENYNDPLVDPNYILNYKHQARRITDKLERPYGEA